MRTLRSKTKMQKLHIIKIGGTLIDDIKALKAFLAQFSEIEGAKILIHGGGKLAETLAEKLKITQTMIDGRRITNKKTLKIVTMVYAGRINKNLVAKLQSFDCNAIDFPEQTATLSKPKKDSIRKLILDLLAISMKKVSITT